RAILSFVFVIARRQDCFQILSPSVFPPFIVTANSRRPPRKHNCVQCLRHAISWRPEKFEYKDDNDFSRDINCVPSDKGKGGYPDLSSTAYSISKDNPPSGNRKIGRLLGRFVAHIRLCVSDNRSDQEYEGLTATKELRKRSRKALSAFRAAVDAKAAASATAASEQRRSERDAQSAAVSAEILATLVDIRNALAIIANYGLPQAGTTQIAADCAWDTSDDEDEDEDEDHKELDDDKDGDYNDEDGKEREDNDEDDD
ncbi:hypothetical protein LB507_008740, partial [Fusarium sp. FIESC RH6]